MTESHEQPNAAWARYYVAQGFAIIPIHVLINGWCSCGKRPCGNTGVEGEPGYRAMGRDAGKHPLQSGWNSPSAWVRSEAAIQRTWGDPRGIPYSIGLVCGTASGVWILDVDPRNGGFESLERLEAEWGASLPTTRVAETGGGGRHFFFKQPPGVKYRKGPLHKDYPGIDVQTDGTQSVLAPSFHASGKRYEWQTPPDQEIVEAPQVLVDMLVGDRGHAGAGLGGAALDIPTLMKSGVPEGERNNTVHKVACRFARKLGTGSDLELQLVVGAVEAFNREFVKPPIEPDELMKITKSAVEFIKANPGVDDLPEGVQKWLDAQAAGGGAGTGSAVVAPPVPDAGAGAAGAAGTGVGAPLPDAPPQLSGAAASVAAVNAQLAGAGASGASGAPAGGSGGGAGGGGGVVGGPQFGPGGLPPDDDSLGPDGQPGHRTLTENGNARRLIDEFGNDLRYTSGMGWFKWAGDAWAHDPERLYLTELCRELPVRITAELPNWLPTSHNDVIDWAARAKGIGMIKKVVDVANSDPRVQVPTATWDSDQFTLGVKNGVVDLRTGQLIPASRDQYITKKTAIEYVPSRRDPRWEVFLDQATNGDKDYQRWLQMAVGYTLTGDTREEKLFIVFGPPGSGKSTFLDIVTALLGTYSLTMDAAAIMQDKGGASQADYYFNAQIAGARMIAVSELPDAQNMKEAAIKRLTGGDTMVGRHPNERPFTFTSIAKMWVATNHQPRIDDVAMWRRILALPFMFTPQIVDKSLKPYLKDPDGGLPAVLSWAVEGAMRWAASRDGLGMCQAVREATEEYRLNEDRIGIFLSEEAVPGEGKAVDLGDLHASYDLWSRDRLEKPMGQTAFRKKLIERGVEVEKVGRVQLVQGWTLLPRAVPDGSWAGALRTAGM